MVKRATKPARAGAAVPDVCEASEDELRSLTDVAADVIRENILDLSLPPGGRLDDKLLFARFGIGRTPAREATNRLVSEGLVEIQRNRGAFVRPLDIGSIQQFFDAYAASERLSGYFCQTGEPGLVDDLNALNAEYERLETARRWSDVTKLNAAIHLRIARATANQYIFDFAARLHNQARRVSFLVYRMEAEGGRVHDSHQRRIRADHRSIVEAIKRGDNAELVNLLTVHVQLFHSRIMNILSIARATGAPLPVSFS